MLRYSPIEEIDWLNKQNSDQDLRVVRRWVTLGEVPTRQQLAGCELDVQRYAQIFPKIEIHRTTRILVVKRLEGENPEFERYRVIIPKGVEDTVIAHYHSEPSSGHYGINVTA